MELTSEQLNSVCKYFYPRDFDGNYRCHEAYCFTCKQSKKDLPCSMCKDGDSCLICPCLKCVEFRVMFYPFILNVRARKKHGLPPKILPPVNLYGGHASEDECSVETILKRINKSTDKIKVDWVYYTICPRGRMGMEYLPTMKNFVADFFDSRFQLYFQELYYVVESGKHADNPNLHIHFVGKFLTDGSHNFRSRLVDCWNKYFHTEDNLYDIKYKIPKKSKGKKKEFNEGIKLVKIRNQTLLNDKIRYLTNEYKGTHMNFTDLGIAKHLLLETPT